MDNDRLFKFLLIICCLINAFHVKDDLALGKKDKNTLIAAMALTVVADFLMLMLRLNLWGILAFCTVQAVHNYRYTNIKRVIIQSATGGLVFVIALFITGFNFLISAGIAYTVFVIYSILGAFAAYNKFPFPNNIVIIVGMVLFLFCDIFVALYNLPLEILERANVYELIQKCIWICYLPGQVLLSSSARKIKLT